MPQSTQLFETVYSVSSAISWINLIFPDKAYDRAAIYREFKKREVRSAMH